MHHAPYASNVRARFGTSGLPAETWSQKVPRATTVTGADVRLSKTRVGHVPSIASGKHSLPIPLT